MGDTPFLGSHSGPRCRCSRSPRTPADRAGTSEIGIRGNIGAGTSEVRPTPSPERPRPGKQSRLIELWARPQDPNSRDPLESYPTITPKQVLGCIMGGSSSAYVGAKGAPEDAELFELSFWPWRRGPDEFQRIAPRPRTSALRRRSEPKCRPGSSARVRANTRLIEPGAGHGRHPNGTAISQIQATPNYDPADPHSHLRVSGKKYMTRRPLHVPGSLRAGVSAFSRHLETLLPKTPPQRYVCEPAVPIASNNVHRANIGALAH